MYENDCPVMRTQSIYRMPLTLPLSNILLYPMFLHLVLNGSKTHLNIFCFLMFREKSTFFILLNKTGMNGTDNNSLKRIGGLVVFGSFKLGFVKLRKKLKSRMIPIKKNNQII